MSGCVNTYVGNYDCHSECTKTFKTLDMVIKHIIKELDDLQSELKQKDKWLVELQKTVNKHQSVILLNGLYKMDIKKSDAHNVEETLLNFLRTLKSSLSSFDHSLKSANGKNIEQLQFDWKLFKQILQAVMALILSLCKMIPDERIKNIVCGLIEALQAVINTLPG